MKGYLTILIDNGSAVRGPRWVDINLRQFKYTQSNSSAYPRFEMNATLYEVRGCISNLSK